MAVRDEAAPYYAKYIDRVPEGPIVEVLRRQLDETLAVLRSVDEARSLHRYEPGKWSIRELLGHVNDCERVFSLRALWFARGFDTPMPSFDQEVAAKGGNAHAVAWSAHVEEFRRVREATLSLFGNLAPEAWERRGIASDNPVSVRALAYICAGHVAHHMAVLQERYLRG